MKLKDWLRDVRGKKEPGDEYVNFAEVPPEPEGPYRARMAASLSHRATPAGFEVKEREVVTGKLELLYRIHCPCDHHWDAFDFQRMSICPNCGRAVLVDPPKGPAG